MSERRIVKWYAFDRMVIGYCLGMTILLALLARPLVDYIDEMSFYLGSIVLANVIVRYLDEDQGGAVRFVRLLYPAILFTFFYRATGTTMDFLFDQFFDPQLTAFEASIFGVNPTLYIDHHLLHPALSEYFLFTYLLYYPMIPVFLIAVFWRKDYDVVRSAVTAFCAIFFASYLMFFLYPIEGPRWFFASQFQNDVSSPVARQLVEFVMASAAVRGGCMPSSHFAVALSIQMYCFKYYRRVGWLILPVVFGLGVGTVWGRYHYVSDLVVGGIIGAVMTILIWKFTDRSRAPSSISMGMEALKENHVT